MTDKLIAALHKTLTYIQARAQKAIVDDYATRLNRIATDALDGDQSESEVERQIVAAIALFALAAFLEGMAQEGATEEDMTDADRRAIQDWIALQGTFAAGLASAIVAARSADNKETARADIINRLGLWVATLEVLRLSGVAQAAGDKMVTWRYGDTDHCETCLSLHGTRRRLSWFTSRGYIPREPNSGTLDCGGWNCQCGLYDDSGERVM